MIRTSRASKSNAVWMALFTCYVTRVVHLDTVPDQSTLAVIRRLKRFVTRRGLPRCFISDNGKTFKAASKYLDIVFKDGSVQERFTGLGVTWQFNVEQALWCGGAFEKNGEINKMLPIEIDWKSSLFSHYTAGRD